MANLFPALVRAQPHYVLPESVVQFQQRSAFGISLSGGGPMARLGAGDLYVYAKAIRLATQEAAGQVAYNQLPTVTMQAEQAATVSYLFRARAEWDHHDVQQASVWDVALPQGQRLGMRQSIFQQLRAAALFGMGNANEGIANTSGATSANLPADPFGNTTVVTYDNGAMSQFVLSVIGALETRLMLIGMPARIAILAPQRILSQWTYNGIVQLTQFQRTGAGVASVTEMIEDVAKRFGCDVEYGCDDTLIGAGQGGNDLVIISAPEIRKPEGGSEINTNEFSNLQPAILSSSLMLCDQVAPREIPTPLPGGATDVLMEMRSTPGWGLRPEAISLISMQYS